MQSHHHYFNHSPMYHNLLFNQRVRLASEDNELSQEGVTAPKHVGAILM